MKKTVKKNTDNSFEISKEMYIYMISVLFIISIIASGLHLTRSFGFKPAVMQKQINNLEYKLNQAKSFKGQNAAVETDKIYKEEKGNEFSVDDVDIDAVNGYFFNNIENYPPFNIKDVKSLEYVDLNNDSQKEAAVILNTKLSYLAEVNKQKNNLKPDGADGEAMINIIGVFKYDAASKMWSPLFLDFVSVSIYDESGAEAEVGNSKLPVLSRIEVTDQKSDTTGTNNVITEITIDKKYSQNNEYKYKLIFNNLELAGKEAIQ